MYRKVDKKGTYSGSWGKRAYFFFIFTVPNLEIKDQGGDYPEDNG